MTKNTFTICFKSKEFVGPPLILPITSPVTPYGPGCQFTWSPATASRLVPRFHLAPGRLGSTWQTGGHTCFCSEPFSGANCRPESPAGRARPARHRSDPLSSSSLPHTLRSSHPGLWGIPMPPATLQDSCTCHTPVLYALPTDTSTLHCIFPFRPLLKSHLPVKPSQVQPRRPQPPLDLETVQSFLLCF